MSNVVIEVADSDSNVDLADLQSQLVDLEARVEALEIQAEAFNEAAEEQEAHDLSSDDDD